MSELSVWICPVCGEILTESEKMLNCPKNHCFDKARSGYVNLLPVSRKITASLLPVSLLTGML